MNSINLFFKRIILRTLYWFYWKCGNRSVRNAYDFLENIKDVTETYLKTKTTYLITEFKGKRLRQVAEYNLRAIILKLLEFTNGEWIGPSRSDIPFLRDKVEELVGRFTFYNESAILYDGLEVKCTVSGADETITKLFLLIQLLYGDYGNIQL
jgi:hypothetical protein